MLLDAFALVALLLDEPAAPEVDALLRDEADPATTGAVNLGEVVDRLCRVGGADSGEVLDALTTLVKGGGLTVHPVEAFEGLLAGTFRELHYHRTDNPLSMADCLALATAMRHAEALATADPPLARTARELGIEVVPLPDSAGRRP